jgi:hypothetical protein
MSLSPIVTSASLAKYKVIWPEELAKGSGPNAVHGARLQVHENGTGNIPATRCLVKVDIDAFKLQVTVSMVGACGIDTMLVRDDLPELCSNLIAALAALDVHKLTHGYLQKVSGERKAVANEPKKLTIALCKALT